MTNGKGWPVCMITSVRERKQTHRRQARMRSRASSVSCRVARHETRRRVAAGSHPHAPRCTENEHNYRQMYRDLLLAEGYVSQATLTNICKALAL